MNGINRRKNIAGFCFLILLSVGVYVFIQKCFDLEDIIAAAADADIAGILCGMFFVCCHLVLGAAALMTIIQSLGDKVSLKRCIRYLGIETFYSSITPSASGGQPVEMIQMVKDGISLSSATITMLLETIIYRIVLLVLGVFVMAINWDVIFSGNCVVIILFIVGLVINCGVVSLLLTLMYSKEFLVTIVTNIIKFFARFKLIRQPSKKIRKFQHLYANYHESAQYIRNNRKVVLKTSVYTLFQRLALFSVPYTVYLAYGGGDKNWLDFLTVAVVLAISVDSMPFPGGTGLAEFVLATVYRHIYTGDLVLSATLLCRGIQFYWYLLIAGMLTAYTFIREKARKRASRGEQRTRYISCPRTCGKRKTKRFHANGGRRRQNRQ